MMRELGETQKNWPSVKLLIYWNEQNYKQPKCSKIRIKKK